MERSKWIRGLGLAVWLGVMSGGQPPSAAALERGAAVGRDIVLITLDTVRPDHLGCYGGDAETPTIDRLAREGTRYVHAVTPVPITLPAHASLLTGREVPVHGVRNNGTYRLGEELPTLAEVLRTAGYATAAFVSAYVLDARYGLDRGFDHYDDTLETNEEMVRLGHLNRRPASAVTDSALAWMAARDPSTPAFVWVHYFDAHLPYEVPVDRQDGVGGNTYDGAIGFIDQELSRLLAPIFESTGGRRTLIMLTADHGEGLGEHGESSHSRLLYDSTMRVPLVTWAPGVVEAGVAEAERYVGLIDVMPTLLDLVDAPHEIPFDGVSMIGPSTSDRAIYMETMAGFLNNGWAPLYALRAREAKYIRAPRPEFYDLVRDPGETNNRFADGPDALKPLVPALDELLTGWPDAEAASAAAASMSPEQIARLRSLGYVGGGGDRSREETPDPKDMIEAWEKASEGLALSAAGDHGGGLSLIIESLKLNPRDAQAWENAALVHQRVSRFDDSEYALRRAIDLVPTAERFAKLAQVLLMQSKLDETDDALDQAEALDDREGRIYLVRGQLQCARGRFDLACPLFERAIEIDPLISGPTATSMLEQARARLEN